MENMDSVIVAKGTHPLLTVVLFGTLVTGLVFSGSYFSKQRSVARGVDDGGGNPV